MYIVAIAWLYVVLMMSLTEQSWIAGVGTFILYGVAPLSLFLWLVGSPARKRRKKAAEAAEAEAAKGAAPASGDGTV
jgi:biotin transporter BioY